MNWITYSSVSAICKPLQYQEGSIDTNVYFCVGKESAEQAPTDQSIRQCLIHFSPIIGTVSPHALNILLEASHTKGHKNSMEIIHVICIISLIMHFHWTSRTKLLIKWSMKHFLNILSIGLFLWIFFHKNTHCFNINRFTIFGHNLQRKLRKINFL